MLKSDHEKEWMSKTPYHSIVGSLMYAMIVTRPNIAFAVGALSRLLSNPGKKHWEAMKFILKYLCGTRIGLYVWVAECIHHWIYIL